MPGDLIIHSLNATYAYLIAKKNRNTSFAIVDSGGDGHFTKLSDAINGGAKKIFIKNGSYSESSDITISDHVIIGETRSGVVIQLNDCSIKYDTSGDSLISNGTTQKIKFTNDSVLVQKAGSADCNFTSVTKDDTTKIYAETLISKIDEITDTNNLNMTAKFFGRTQDVFGTDFSMDYSLINFTSINSLITNLTFNHFLTSDDECIEVYGIDHIIDNVSFYSIQNRSTFIKLGNSQPALNTKILNCSFEGGKYSLDLENCAITTIEGCYFAQASTQIIKSSDNAEYTAIINNVLTSSTSGINLSARYWTIKENEFSMIRTNAINATKAGIVLGLKINDNNFQYCGSSTTGEETIYNYCYGTNISGNSFYDCYGIRLNLSITISVNTNIFEQCKSCIVINSGNKVIVDANHFFNIPAGEYCITSNTSNCTYTNNQFDDCLPINNILNGNFSGNNVLFSSDTTITFSNPNSSINANFFVKTNIIVSGDGISMRANRISDTVAGYGVTVTADKCMFSGNVFDTLENGIDIQATADKTHLLQCTFNTITTTAINNAGTNTVQDNNIT